MPVKPFKHTYLKFKITGLIIGTFTVTWAMIAHRDVKNINITNDNDQSISDEVIKEESMPSKKSEDKRSEQVMEVNQPENQEKEIITAIKNNKKNIEEYETSDIVSAQPANTASTLQKETEPVLTETVSDLPDSSVTDIRLLQASDNVTRITDPDQPDTSTTTT